MIGKIIVLDANILIRAALGIKVRDLITDYAPFIRFITPDVAWIDAHTYVPALLQKRGISHSANLTLNLLETLVDTLEPAHYGEYKTVALKRIAQRDADDWPILASAMALNCPIWTEDLDFFGTGIATWTTDRVHLYFDEPGHIHSPQPEPGQ